MDREAQLGNKLWTNEDKMCTVINQSETVTGKSTEGPSTMHLHTKCLDFKGVGLTLISPSEKLPLPKTAELGVGPKTA